MARRTAFHTARPEADWRQGHATPRMMLMRQLLLVLVSVSTAASAQEQVVRLSPEQAQAAVEAGVERRMAAERERLGDSASSLDRRAHGSVSAFVSNRGHGIAADMAAPVGESGYVGVAVSSVSGSFGYGPHRRGHDDDPAGRQGRAVLRPGG